MFKYTDIDLVRERYFDGVFSQEQDGTPIINFPQDRIFSTEVDGRTYTVKFNLAQQLSTLMLPSNNPLITHGNPYFDCLKQNPYLTRWSNSHLVDTYARLRWETEYLVAKKFHTGDAEKWYTPPELTVNQLRTRMGFFLKVCHMCSQDEVLTAIIKQAPKRDNGALCLNREIKIATLPCGYNADMDYVKSPKDIGAGYVQLVAIAADYNTLEFKIVEDSAVPSTIAEAFDDMLSNTPELFALDVNLDKFTKHLFDKRIEVVFDNIAVRVPTCTLSDGKLAFASDSPVAIDSFDEILVKKDDKYEVVLSDASETIQQIIGKHLMTITYDMSGFAPKFKCAWEKLWKDSQYYLGERDFSHRMDTEGLSMFYYYRELYFDESLIADVVVALLRHAQSAVLGEGRDIVEWTKNAAFKKDGTFNRSRVQNYTFSGELVDTGSSDVDYYCKAIDDKHYRINFTYIIGSLDFAYHHYWDSEVFQQKKRDRFN